MCSVCSNLCSNRLHVWDAYNTHTHSRLTALFAGLPGWAGTRKVTPIWIFVKQETVSGSGISWAVCKSAPCSRQITTPAPHFSVFYRPDALPAAQPTASKHWRHTWDAYNQPENANWLSVKDKGCQIQRTAMNFWNYIFPNTVWVSFAISVVLCVVPYEVIWYKILYNIVQHNNNNLQPVYRSTCVSRHLQLRTGGFYWYKVLLPTCLCWREPAHSG